MSFLRLQKKKSYVTIENTECVTEKAGCRYPPAFSATDAPVILKTGTGKEAEYVG